jgi:agmatinase/guanidinopropionase
MEAREPNPALGATLEPFHGITTFMRLPASRKLEGIDVAIVGIPFDSGTTYRSGARFGPRSIRQSSLMLWGFNRAFDVSPAQELKIVDYGDASVVPVDIEETMENITRETTEVIQAGATVVALGGDHSISLPLLRAHAAKYGELAVVHFDSHPDTWDREFANQRYSHGTPFRRAIEEKLIDAGAYCQVGIRGTFADPDMQRALGSRTVKVLTMDQLMDSGIPSALNEIHTTVRERPVYVSLDIDAVDPAFAPGTGTPEVGGLSSYQILQLVRGLRGLNLIGFDLVEVSPAYDHADITSILAANLAFEFLSMLASRQASAWPAGEKQGERD